MILFYHPIILTLFSDVIQKKTLRGNEKIGDNDKRRAEMGVH